MVGIALLLDPAAWTATWDVALEPGLPSEKTQRRWYASLEAPALAGPPREGILQEAGKALSSGHLGAQHGLSAGTQEGRVSVAHCCDATEDEKARIVRCSYILRRYQRLRLDAT